MKKLILATLFALSSVSAFADHTLDSAMEDNPEIARAVEAIQRAADVSCDISNSRQDYYNKKEVGQLGSAWKQTAACSSKGVPAGKLTVSYKWENYKATRLLQISFQAKK